MNQKINLELRSYYKCKTWPDIGNWLHRLLEILKQYNDVNIQEQVQLSKRLAQCCNPTLPPGIHEMTLTIYDRIFSIICLSDPLKLTSQNQAQMANSLAYFTIGLFSFFRSASASVPHSARLRIHVSCARLAHTRASHTTQTTRTTNHTPHAPHISHTTHHTRLSHLVKAAPRPPPAALLLVVRRLEGGRAAAANVSSPALRATDQALSPEADLAVLLSIEARPDSVSSGDHNGGTSRTGRAKRADAEDRVLVFRQPDRKLRERDLLLWRAVADDPASGEGQEFRPQAAHQEAQEEHALRRGQAGG